LYAEPPWPLISSCSIATPSSASGSEAIPLFARLYREAEQSFAHSMYGERAPLRLSFMCAKSVPNKIHRHTRYENADADKSITRITVDGICYHAPGSKTEKCRADRVPRHSELSRRLIAPAQHEKATRRYPEEDPIH